MQGVLSVLEKCYLGAIVLIGVAWVLDVPQFFGFSLISAEWIGPLLAVGIAAAFLRHPYAKGPGAVEGGARSGGDRQLVVDGVELLRLDRRHLRLHAREIPAGHRRDPAADGGAEKVRRMADHDSGLGAHRVRVLRLPHAATVRGRAAADAAADHVPVRGYQRGARPGADRRRAAGARVHHSRQAHGSHRGDQVLHRSRAGSDGASPRRAGEGRGRGLEHLRLHQRHLRRQHHVHRDRDHSR